MLRLWTLGSTVVLGTLVSGIAGAARRQDTVRASVDSSGGEANDDNDVGGISGDGRYVTFSSHASNLVPGDTNGEQDIFVHDRQSGATTRVSVDSSGAQSNGFSWSSSISSDGRYVAFPSTASNLVPGDTNSTSDIFVHDRESGTTIRVSVDSSAAQGNGACYWASISADGGRVAFDSIASNLVPADANDRSDVFVHDLTNATTFRVSIDSVGREADSTSRDPSISADGSCVSFQSYATNLVPADTNSVPDIFVHEIQSGLTTRASVSSSGVQANHYCHEASLSADGRYVGFSTYASNLVPGDTNDESDVFVHDRQSGETIRVSVSSSGVEGNRGSFNPDVSTDGRFVTFSSNAKYLVSGDTHNIKDVFVHDLANGTTKRVSVSSRGSPGDGDSYGGYISADERYVAFTSEAADLVSGDTNSKTDVFVHGCDITGVDYCTANSNSTGLPADISSCCSNSSAAGRLTFEVVPVPNQLGIFFHGATPTQIVFGNGMLCVSNDIVRGAVIQGADNYATYTYDNSDVRHSLSAYVGSTRHFQYWFRDTQGGGALFNTSNATSVPIVP